MVNLLSFVECFSAADLARGLNVTTSAVLQWAAGARPVPIPRCVQIERATKGKVTRQELRADWRQIWPELEAIERAARAIRAARRPSTRSGAAGYAPWPSPLSRPTRRPKKTTMLDLLLLNVPRSTARRKTRLAEPRL